MTLVDPHQLLMTRDRDRVAKIVLTDRTWDLGPSKVWSSGLRFFVDSNSNDKILEVFLRVALFI